MEPLHEGRYNNSENRRRFYRVGAILLVVGVIAIVIYTLYAKTHVSTDDAFIDAHIASLSAKVAGQVERVVVEDNQKVRKGDVLVEIDPRDFQVKLAQMKAEKDAADAEARRAATDATRHKQLFEKQQISRQVLDRSVADADVAVARARVAEAKMEAAGLDLSYTKISAPEDGTVAKRAVEVRSYVQVGQPLMAVIPNQVWVIAKFKETQLKKIKPGQKVRIRVDAYSDRRFNGHVDSIQPGAEARFSLFPPENATGNYVKVVQRVPVKILFDEPTDGFWLAPGMSVVPTVRVE
ncbi:MAG: HlyD family secretion protein [Pseudomonadota bacterium]